MDTCLPTNLNYKVLNIHPLSHFLYASLPAKQLLACDDYHSHLLLNNFSTYVSIKNRIPFYAFKSK